MAHERRFNASKADKLDLPERQRWLPQTQVLDALAVQPGEAIVDIGAGTGYFALPLARAAGPAGKVYAIDAQDEMLARLAEKMRDSGPANIELIRAEAESIELFDRSCDLVFMANVWHEFDNRAAVVREAARLLRAGGRIGILDWRPDVEPDHGPPLEHRLSPEDAGEVLRSTGATQIASVNVGKYSWLVTGVVSGE